MAIVRVEDFLRLFPVQGHRVVLGLFNEAHIGKKYLGWLNDPEVVRYSNQRFQ